MSASETTNPVFLREMRQAARLTRTPVILATVTAIGALIVCSVGGAASASAAPAEVGSVIFHTFFSLAFAVVCWVGPGVAALTVASERTSRTWESVVLTGLSPRVIARGKLAASLTYIGLYVVALAPVGALPFLFGGVTATEVLLAFVVLGVFAVLSVGFGLAVSSGARSPATALLVALPLAVGISLFTDFALGIGLSVAAHDHWPGVAEGAPVWLPTAYARADLGADYFVYLIVMPLTLAAVLAFLFYEVTVSNLSDPNDDRSTGLKRWFVASSAALVIVSLLPALLVPDDKWVAVLFAVGACLTLSLLTLFALSSEPPGPSRRVLSVWDREHATALRRFLGPGMARTAVLLVLVTAVCELLVFSAGTAITGHASTSDFDHAESIAVFAAYGTCFFAFLVGYATFARTQPTSRFTPRARLGLVLFFATSGPLFAVAITGLGKSLFEGSSLLAAPSPLYVIAMMTDLDRASGPHATLWPGFVAMTLWAVAGLVLGVVGAARLRRTENDERAAWTALDAQIAREESPT